MLGKRQYQKQLGAFSVMKDFILAPSFPAAMEE